MSISKKRNSKAKKAVKRQWLPSYPTDILSDPKTRILDLNDAPDELKLSAKIITMIEPFLPDIPVEILADCAVLAWNACVSGEDNYSSVDYLHNGIADADMEQRALIAQLKTRKNKLFPTDMRTIVRMQVVKGEDGNPRINVASEVKPPDFLQMLEQLRDME